MRRGSWFAAVLVMAAAVVGAGDVAAAMPSASEAPSIAAPDGEIFMRVHATPEQIAAVRTRVRRSPLIRQFAFVTKADALRAYRKMFAGDDRMLAQATAETLPSSFVLNFAKA